MSSFTFFHASNLNYRHLHLILELLFRYLALRFVFLVKVRRKNLLRNTLIHTLSRDLSKYHGAIDTFFSEPSTPGSLTVLHKCFQFESENWKHWRRYGSRSGCHVYETAGAPLGLVSSSRFGRKPFSPVSSVHPSSRVPMPSHLFLSYEEPPTTSWQCPTYSPPEK